MADELIANAKGLLSPWPAQTDRLACFRYGFSFPLRGYRYLRQEPEVFKWVLIPLILNIQLVMFAFWGASWGAPVLLAGVWAVPSGGFALTAWNSVSMLFGLILFAFGIVLLYVVSGVLGTPFYDYMTSQVERRLAGIDEEPTDWRQFWGDVAQSVRHSVVAFLLWASVMMPLFCVGLIPAVGPIIEVVFGCLVTSLFLAREMMDGAMSRRRYTFGRKIQVVRNHLMVMFGFGLACMLLLWVPLLNFFFMPIAMVGGTLLFLSIESLGNSGLSSQ